MNIIPNLTLSALQLLPFLLTLVALNFIIFQPMLAYLEQRSANNEGAQKDAIRLQEEAAEKLAELEAKLTQARIKISEMRAEARKEAAQEHSQAINEARSQAASTVAEAVNEIQSLQRTARSSLETQSNTYAASIASKVLGREISTSVL
jgi:F-type H+-transporting ATPase subunit b